MKPMTGPITSDDTPHPESRFFFFLLSALASAQDVASFEERIPVKKLPNSLTLIFCERPEAPVFSLYARVDAGSAQDPMHATGLAHMFEHMAFKAAGDCPVRRGQFRGNPLQRFNWRRC